MQTIQRIEGALPTAEQQVVSQGFARHSAQRETPAYDQRPLSWVVYGADGALIGALTSKLLWDWMYIDELWVRESERGTGLGKALMVAAEQHARQSGLAGLWLWTQSWQAADFYRGIGFSEFTRFENFPKGHSRIGFRKQL